MSRSSERRTPSRAQCQARADRTRGRHSRPRRTPRDGEIPGQLSIEDALAEIALEQAGGEDQ